MPIPDDFATTASSILGPFTKGTDITPSDSADLPFLPRAITCRVAGLVQLQWQDGSTSVHSLAVGIPFWCRPARIYATTTTATGIAILK